MAETLPARQSGKLEAVVVVVVWGSLRASLWPVNPAWVYNMVLGLGSWGIGSVWPMMWEVRISSKVHSMDMCKNEVKYE